VRGVRKVVVIIVTDVCNRRLAVAGAEQALDSNTKASILVSEKSTKLSVVGREVLVDTVCDATHAVGRASW
jgi:hypothetical protein